MELPDAVLVRKSIEGDDFAFRALVNKHSGIVYGLCYHLVQNFADAEDLAQEAFTRAYYRLSSLSNPAKFLSWLRQVTLNVCYNWLHRQKSDSITLKSIIEKPDVSPSPADICETEELQEKVAEAIASLSEKNRQTVTLYYMDGCSCDEVANFLDISISAVQSRLYEARKQLKKELIGMVKENLESHKLSEDFEARVLEAIEQARKAKGQYIYREVIIHCDEALETLKKLSDSQEHKKMMKEALWLKGDAFDQHADVEKAIKYHEAALGIEKEIGDKTSQARLMEEIARHYANSGNNEEGAKYYEQALEIYTKLGDKAGQARVLLWLGSSNLVARDVEKSIPYYQKAFDLFVETGDKEWEALSHAGVKLLDQFSEQIGGVSIEEGETKVIFYGALCETFSRSSDVLTHIKMGGTLGAYIRTSEEKDEFSDEDKPSPFRFYFLPCMTSKMKLLDFSISTGDSWSSDIPSGGLDPMKITITIQSKSETISVPAGKFTNCLKVQMVTSEEPEDCDETQCGVREFIYAPGIGLVKSTFTRRNGITDIVQLTDFTVHSKDDDYFPLDTGNKWVHEWEDESSSLLTSTDIHEVIGVDSKGYYQVSHYYCALKQANQSSIK